MTTRIVGLLALAACSCAASSIWTYHPEWGYWGATLPNTGQGTCWAVAYQAEMPTQDHCRVEVTNRSVPLGSHILPETTTAITGTLTNTGDQMMYAGLWFQDALGYENTLWLGPGESYTGAIGAVFGRWTALYGMMSPLGVQKTINFSQLPGGSYRETAYVYTDAEIGTFTFETPEPGTLALTGAALIALLRSRLRA